MFALFLCLTNLLLVAEGVDDVSPFIDYNDCKWEYGHYQILPECPEFHVAVGACDSKMIDDRCGGQGAEGGWTGLKCCRLMIGGQYSFLHAVPYHEM